MKITNRQIINTINTYNAYQAQIHKIRKEQVEHDAYEDEIDVKDCERRIKEVNEELGKFLDREV